MNTEKHENAMCDLEQVRTALNIIADRTMPDNVRARSGELSERTYRDLFDTWCALQVIVRELTRCDKAIEAGFMEMLLDASDGEPTPQEGGSDA